jgi:hypothetical protein
MTKNKLPSTNGIAPKGSLSNVICGIVEVQYGTTDHGRKPSRSQDPLGNVIRLVDRDQLGAAGTASAPVQLEAARLVPVRDLPPALGAPRPDRVRPRGRRSGMDPAHSPARIEGAPIVSGTASNPRRPTYLTISQTAWLLGVPDSIIHRAIRVGTLRAAWRRSRLVVAESDLRQLMPGGAA